MNVWYFYTGNVSVEMGANVLKGAMEEARRRGVDLHYEMWRFSIKEFYESRAYKEYDGILAIIPPDEAYQRYWREIEKEVPCVNMFFSPLHEKMNIVYPDEVGSAKQAVAHFLEQGYTSIGFYNSYEGGYIIPRYKGYRAALDEYGLPFDEGWVYGYDAVTDTPVQEPPTEDTSLGIYLHTDNIPDAFIVVSSYVAFKIYLAYQHLGLRVPEDKGLLSFSVPEGIDSLFELEHKRGFLSTFDDDYYRVGVEAVRLIYRILLEHVPAEGNVVTVPRLFHPFHSSLRKSALEEIHKRAFTLEAMDAHIEEHMDNENISHIIAAHYGLSQKYFLIKFKNTFNENFTAYVNNVRLRKSQELLTKTDMPIIRIIYEVGFNDSKKFYYWFNKHFKCTPSAYREKFKK